MILYPQLPHPVAEQLAEELSAASLKGAAARAAIDHPDSFYTATGGSRADESRLRSVQRDLRNLAGRHGFPDGGSESSRMKFDQEAAAFLQDCLQLAPAEGAKPGVWEFFACVMACDVVRWRFPGSSSSGTPIERFTGGRRNVFQRLWWRATVLRDPGAKSPGDILNALGEDEIVQIMERPFLAGSRVLARTVAAELIQASMRYPKLTRRTLIREGQKRLRRLGAYVSFETVREEELTSLVRQTFTDVARSVTA